MNLWLTWTALAYWQGFFTGIFFMLLCAVAVALLRR